LNFRRQEEPSFVTGAAPARFFNRACVSRS